MCCYSDVINLLNYDLILGTPCFFQHRLHIGLNPTTVKVGSAQPLAIEGKQLHVLESRAADVLEDHLEQALKILRTHAEPICHEASDSPLPVSYQPYNSAEGSCQGLLLATLKVSRHAPRYLDGKV